MANSKFILTFTEMPNVNEIIRITETSLNLNLNEVFKTNRLGLFQTKIPEQNNVGTVESPEIVYFGYISENYKNAFNLDHNSTNLFTVTTNNAEPGSGLGSVVVQANFPGAEFLIVSNTAGVDIEIINETASEGITIDSVEFSEADTTPCQLSKCSITTSVLATKILSPIIVNDNTDNPIQFDVLRGQIITVTVENSDGNQATEVIQTPSVLYPDNFSLQINSSPNGATVVVNSQSTDGLVLEYSLDGDTWQSENVFSGLEPDDYTLYVRDHLGCSFELPFTVSESGINVPHFYISKSNSLRFAQRITFGTSQNYKTDENTLSCEVDVAIPYHQVQVFNTSDIITTQFQSNYPSNAFRIQKADGNYDTIPVLQKTNFTNIRDKRDARKYDLGDGKTGIYFLNGNIYDYDTDAVTGTHALNGLVPQWAIAGNYINLSGSWFIIERVIFDESKNADVIVISQIYSGVDSAVVVGCIYNIYPYEIYEATVDMGNYINQSIRAEFVCSGSSFPTITHLSEQIDVATSHEFTLDINYWNDDNNDIYYASGIRHRIRVPYTKIEGVSDSESAVHKTDTNAILLSSTLYEGKKFIFEPVTEEIWRKLMMALSHKNVFINGVKYVKDGDFETDGPLEDSNLYVLKAQMLKAGNVYNSDGSTFGAGNASNSEIPGFVEGNDGFVSY